MTPQELIKSFEKCRLKAYLDSGKPPVATIGWGTTVYANGLKVKLGDVITQEQADAEFDHYFDKMNSRLRKEILYPNLFSDNQWAALCSLCYNIGDEAFKNSTILKMLNEFSPLIPGNWFDLAHEITKWHYDNGKSVDGLVARRKAERELFLS